MHILMARYTYTWIHKEFVRCPAPPAGDDTVDAEGGSAAESRLTTALAEFATMQDQHVASSGQHGQVGGG